MDNKLNVITGMSLAQYNKKYRNRQHKLLKISKKEMDVFTKNECKGDISKNVILNKRRWCLIEDTYYEIPKFPRFTWFRNLSTAAQITTCVLGAGVVATAVTLPIVLNANKTINVDTLFNESNGYINNPMEFIQGKRYTINVNVSKDKTSVKYIDLFTADSDRVNITDYCDKNSIDLKVNGNNLNYSFDTYSSAVYLEFEDTVYNGKITFTFTCCKTEKLIFFFNYI